MPAGSDAPRDPLDQRAPVRASRQALKPIPDGVTPEVRQFTETLRGIFGVSGTTLRRLAVEMHYDAGTVSRYLSGQRTPPREFVEKLLRICYEGQSAPVTDEVEKFLFRQRLAALESSEPATHRIELLNDQLAFALTEKRACENTILLLERDIEQSKSRIYDLEREKRQILASWEDERQRTDDALAAESAQREVLEQTIHGLQREVSQLNAQLARALERADAAEERCLGLEVQIDAASMLIGDGDEGTSAPVQEQQQQQPAGRPAGKGVLHTPARPGTAAFAPSGLQHRPYFYLSYAHTPQQRDDETHPDLWVDRLFTDLSAHIAQLTDIPRGLPAGFTDRELRAGNDWPMNLSRQLANCRVFVPLYSRRYFNSVDCGREWFYFQQRALNQATRVGQSVDVIVPAIWVPVDLRELPPAAAEINVSYANNEHYAHLGLYGITKLTRFRDDYEEVIYSLARRIIEAAERSSLQDGLITEYESLEYAFGGDSPDTPYERRLLITIVASEQDALPEGRSSNNYGPSPLDWNPYGPDSVRPIAEHAAAVARSLGYRAEVGHLDEHADGLLSSSPPSAPQVLIIDPWALLGPHCQQVLRRFDALNSPWVKLLIPWSQLDTESANADAADRLRVVSNSTIPSAMAQTRTTSKTAVHGVPTLDEFTMVLARLIRAANRQYLKHAQAYPPGPD